MKNINAMGFESLKEPKFNGILGVEGNPTWGGGSNPDTGAPAAAGECTGGGCQLAGIVRCGPHWDSVCFIYYTWTGDDERGNYGESYVRGASWRYYKFR